MQHLHIFVYICYIWHICANLPCMTYLFTDEGAGTTFWCQWHLTWRVFWTIFQHLRKNKKLPLRIQAVDMQYILLLLPFLMDKLLQDVVQEHSRNFPLQPVYHPRSWLELPCYSFDGVCSIADNFHQRMRWMSKKWLFSVSSKNTFYIFHILYIFYIFYVYYACMTYSFDCFRYHEQCLVVFQYKNKHDHPIMATGKKPQYQAYTYWHSELLWYNQCFLWSSRNSSQGLGQEPRSLHKSRAACPVYYDDTFFAHWSCFFAVWRSSRQYNTYITYFTYCTYLTYAAYPTNCILYTSVMFLACFQHELIMARKRMTGISRISPPRQICPSGLIADSNNQIRHCQVGILQEFTSIYGTAQRYVNFWFTLCLVVAVTRLTTWVTMQCNGGQLLMAMLASLGNMLYWELCQTK